MNGVLLKLLCLFYVRDLFIAFSCWFANGYIQVFLALSNDSAIHVFDYYEAALKVGWMTSTSTSEMVLWLVSSVLCIKYAVCRRLFIFFFFIALTPSIGWQQRHSPHKDLCHVSSAVFSGQVEKKLSGEPYNSGSPRNRDGGFGVVAFWEGATLAQD